MKKTLSERYFAKSSYKILDPLWFVFIALTAVGLLFYFVISNIFWSTYFLGIYCTGIGGIGLVITYLVRESFLVKDTDYDNTLKKAVNALPCDELLDLKISESTEFSAYCAGTDGMIKRGKDRRIRTDCYCESTVAIQTNGSVLILLKYAHADGKTEKKVYTTRLGEVNASLESRTYDTSAELKIDYIVLRKEGAVICEIPVPVSSYEVDTLCNALNISKA